jgi:hypothetical protein
MSSCKPSTALSGCIEQPRFAWYFLFPRDTSLGPVEWLKECAGTREGTSEYQRDIESIVFGMLLYPHLWKEHVPVDCSGWASDENLLGRSFSRISSDRLAAVPTGDGLRQTESLAHEAACPWSL